MRGMSRDPRPRSARPRGAALAMAALYLPMLLVGVAWIVWRDGWAGMARAFVGGRAIPSVAAGAALAIGTSIAIHRSPLARTRPIRRMKRFFGRLLPRLTTREAWILAIASGLTEEILFRGALQPAVGLVPASLIFGLLHFPADRRLLAWPIFGVTMGLALGGIQEATSCLLGPVLAHATINLLSLRSLVRHPPGHSLSH